MSASAFQAIHEADAWRVTNGLLRERDALRAAAEVLARHVARVVTGVELEAWIEMLTRYPADDRVAHELTSVLRDARDVRESS